MGLTTGALMVPKIVSETVVSVTCVKRYTPSVRPLDQVMPTTGALFMLAVLTRNCPSMIYVLLATGTKERPTFIALVVVVVISEVRAA